jgi:hypothetical protein
MDMSGVGWWFGRVGIRNRWYAQPLVLALLVSRSHWLCLPSPDSANAFRAPVPLDAEKLNIFM